MGTDKRDLISVLRYAKAHCEDRCPSERDPGTCLALIGMCEAAGEGMPSCYEETGGFSKAFFHAKIREVEKRRGKKVQDVLAEFKEKGCRTMEDQIDKMDAEFAIGAIKAINDRAKATKA